MELKSVGRNTCKHGSRTECQPDLLDITLNYTWGHYALHTLSSQHDRYIRPDQGISTDFLPAYSISDTDFVRRIQLKDNTSALKLWLLQHKTNPYPSKPEKIMLAILARMTLTQVSTWFANARRRLKKEYPDVGYFSTEKTNQSMYFYRD